MPMQAQAFEYEKPFLASREKLEDLIKELISPQALEMSHCELESLIEGRGVELLRQLMQDHLDLRFQKERRKQVIGKDGINRSRVKDTDRGLMTIFGPVVVDRLGYSAPGVKSLHPADAELNLPKEYYSLGLRKRVAEQASKVSFEEVIKTINSTTGATLAKRQAEELTIRAATDFEEFYQQRSQTVASVEEAKSSASILVLSTDAKGIVVRKSDLREPTRKAALKQKHKLDKHISRGEKRNRKRMAQVASVYTIEPFIRSAEDIVNEFRPLKDADRERKRPKPEQKRVWASIERDSEKVIAEVIEEARRRDPKQKKKWVGLVDGNPRQLNMLEKAARAAGVELLVILDLMHVLSYLWKAAFVFHKEGTKEAQNWVRERLLSILKGKSSLVAAGMRRSATLNKLKKQTREPVDKCADYLLNYSKYLRYDQYLAQGLPISTGVIEGACRHLIQDRMDITGARWSLKGAEAVLRLRSLRSSNDFFQYWHFHLEKEFHRNHSPLYLEAVRG